MDAGVSSEASAVSRQQRDSAAVEMALMPAVTDGDNNQNPTDNDTSTSLCYRRDSEQLQP